MIKKLITVLCTAALALPAFVLALEPYAQCIADAGSNSTAIAACQGTTSQSSGTAQESATTTSQSWLVTSGYANNPAYMTCHNAALALSSGVEAAIGECQKKYPLPKTSLQLCLENVTLGDMAGYQACITGGTSSTNSTTVSVTPVTTSSTQTSNQTEIQRLLTMVGQLTTVIQQLTLGGTSGAKKSCTASRSMSRGMSGEDVKQLQVLLIARGFLAAGNDTGFFGPLTEAAVKQLQTALGIVSSGTPESTGWGSAGPKTRAALGICI